MQSKWSRFVIVALVGGSCLAGYCLLGTLATAASPVKDDPLAGVTQNWDTVITGPARFSILPTFNGLAVRDNETGLVWEKSPSSSPAADWVQATANCVNKSIAGRKGWRLPSVVELATLIETSQSVPTLPAGHPFTNVQADNYWTATTYAQDANIAWGVNFNGGSVSVVLFKNGNGLFAWCVRGPMNTDAY
jgi:hypothetical protein